MAHISARTSRASSERERDPHSCPPPPSSPGHHRLPLRLLRVPCSERAQQEAVRGNKGLPVNNQFPAFCCWLIIDHLRREKRLKFDRSVINGIFHSSAPAREWLKGSANDRADPVSGSLRQRAFVPAQQCIALLPPLPIPVTRTHTVLRYTQSRSPPTHAAPSRERLASQRHLRLTWPVCLQEPKARRSPSRLTGGGSCKRGTAPLENEVAHRERLPGPGCSALTPMGRDSWRFMEAS